MGEAGVSCRGCWVRCPGARESTLQGRFGEVPVEDQARSTEYVHAIMGGVVDISGREASYQRFGVVVINARRVDLGGPMAELRGGLSLRVWDGA